MTGSYTAGELDIAAVMGAPLTLHLMLTELQIFAAMVRPCTLR